jgi:hypothetical protein
VLLGHGVCQRPDPLAHVHVPRQRAVPRQVLRRPRRADVRPDR